MTKSPFQPTQWDFVKHLLVFFAFIVVSLAPVYADEGYIPFFPDFLEPDGIGFRGPASILSQTCWADHNCGGQLNKEYLAYSRIRKNQHPYLQK